MMRSLVFFFFKATERLQSVLPEYWRSSQRRKKLRAVSCEELPWRAQVLFFIYLFIYVIFELINRNEGPTLYRLIYSTTGKYWSHFRIRAPT